jgi:hypothetical protein
MNKIIKPVLLAFILMAGAAVFTSAAYGQAARRIPFVKGKISATIKGVGTQTYLVRITNGDMEFVARIASRGKVAKAEVRGRDGRDIVDDPDKTDIWETLGNGEYRLTIRAPKGTAFTLKLEVYKLEGQS